MVLTAILFSVFRQGGHDRFSPEGGELMIASVHTGGINANTTWMSRKLAVSGHGIEGVCYVPAVQMRVRVR